MAKCEKREIPQPKPPVEYVLTLSYAEAKELSDFLFTSKMTDAEACVLCGISGAIDNARLS